MDEYKKAVAHANSVNHEDWMMKGFLKQAQELSKLMKKTSHLLKMQWAETAELVI
jgi:hypothetical protein